MPLKGGCSEQARFTISPPLIVTRLKSIVFEYFFTGGTIHLNHKLRELPDAKTSQAYPNLSCGCDLDLSVGLYDEHRPK